MNIKGQQMQALPLVVGAIVVLVAGGFLLTLVAKAAEPTDDVVSGVTSCEEQVGKIANVLIAGATASKAECFVYPGCSDKEGEDRTSNTGNQQWWMIGQHGCSDAEPDADTGLDRTYCCVEVIGADNLLGTGTRLRCTAGIQEHMDTCNDVLLNDNGRWIHSQNTDGTCNECFVRSGSCVYEESKPC